MRLLVELLIGIAATVMIVYRFWQRKGIPVVSVHEVHQRLSGHDRMTIVDVRSEAEFTKGHLRGAINLPLDRIEEAAQIFDPSGEVIVMCQRGMRSLKACRQLQALGFTQVRTMDGGLVRWAWDTVSGR